MRVRLLSPLIALLAVAGAGLPALAAEEPTPAGAASADAPSGSAEPSSTATASASPPEEVRPSETPSSTATSTAWSTATATPSSGPTTVTQPAPPPAPRVIRGRMTVGGLARSYVLVLPGFVPDAPLPLLVMLHGRGSTYEISAARTGFDHLARVGAAAVVYPQAAGPSWNAGRCCDDAVSRRVDDVGFLTAVVGAASRTVPVDPRRVVVAGHSTGGMMAYRLACERPRVFAGIASVGGTMVTTTCPGGPPVSVLQISGTADSGVPYYGTARSPVLGVWLPPIPSTVGAWRGRDGCTSAEIRRQIGRVWIRTWPACRSRSEVSLVTYEGIRHGWPQAKDGYAASDLVWSFLRHRIRST